MLSPVRRDETIQIWDITTGQCIHTLSGKHASAVTSLQYIGHGLLTTSSDDGTVKLWDIDKGSYRILCQLDD